MQEKCNYARKWPACSDSNLGLFITLPQARPKFGLSPWGSLLIQPLGQGIWVTSRSRSGFFSRKMPRTNCDKQTQFPSSSIIFSQTVSTKKTPSFLNIALEPFPTWTAEEGRSYVPSFGKTDKRTDRRVTVFPVLNIAYYTLPRNETYTCKREMLRYIYIWVVLVMSIKQLTHGRFLLFHVSAQSAKRGSATKPEIKAGVFGAAAFMTSSL
ncbi:hypothetical protein J6590_046340 [Homalodisca vitripennis]|nr:hypothetical protein J6590_046340 [Homalodisca vitripennis]